MTTPGAQIPIYRAEELGIFIHVDSICRILLLYGAHDKYGISIDG
jgi:hypothetical protein